MNTEQFNTGDILLFHHKPKYTDCFNCIYSCFTDTIMDVTHSKYSHSAIIIRDPQFTNPPLKGLYVLEASFELFPDVEDKKYKFGVELEEFDKVMRDARTYGNVYWRKLNCQRDEKFYQILAKMHQVVHDKPYDCLPKDWIDAIFHHDSGSNAQSTKSFWCSALVGYAYVMWGFLPKTTPWSMVSPKMFGTESPDKYQLEFTNCTVDKEVKLF